MHHGHHEPHDPQPDVGAVFQPQVEQPERRPGDLQQQFPVHRLESDGYVGQYVQRRLREVVGRVDPPAVLHVGIAVAVAFVLLVEEVVEHHAETHAPHLACAQGVAQIQVRDAVGVH